MHGSWVRGRAARVLYCTSGVSFLIMLDSNIVAVSLPTIARNLNATFADIEWVVSAYVLTFAALLMPAGALADRFGRRRTLLVGLTVFTVASLLCGLATTAIMLNAARAIQGVGSALQLSAALAILGHTFRGSDRARAFGFWGTVIGIAVTVGPIVGGLITSSVGWRWAFLVNVPVGAILIAMAAGSVEESRDPHALRLDFVGMITFGSGLLFVVWALISAGSVGWGSRPTEMKLLAGVGLIVLFAVAERLQERPMVDLALFRRPTFIGASLAMLAYAATAQVMMTYLPLYLQNVFSLTPGMTGLGMLPFALPLFFMPRVAANLAGRISGRSLLTLGLAIVALGNLGTGALVSNDMPYLFVALGMLITGCGAGLLNGETAKVSMSVVPPERGGMASGISGTLRFVGIVTGLTGLGTILAGRTARHLAAAIPEIGHTANLHAMTSQIVAGDLVGAMAGVPADAREAFRELARASFAAGFTVLLLTAGVIASISALLVYALVNPRETAPHA